MKSVPNYQDRLPDIKKRAGEGRRTKRGREEGKEEKKNIGKKRKKKIRKTQEEKETLLSLSSEDN